MKIHAKKKLPSAKWRELGRGPSEVKRCKSHVALANNGGIMESRPWYSITIQGHNETFDLSMSESEARKIYRALGQTLPP